MSLVPRNAGEASADLDLTEIIAVLSRTPGVLRAWLGGLPDAWLDANEGPETFSARDVVGHLIEGERTDWVPRLRMILEDGETRTFEPFDRFAFRDTIAGRTIESLCDEFDQRRRDNLAWLRGRSLTTKDFARRGRHPAFGVVTLGELLSTWTVHDLNHLGQIARVMSKRYATAVGHWREYLGILSR